VGSIPMHFRHPLHAGLRMYPLAGVPRGEPSEGASVLKLPSEVNHPSARS
jgi:hypothetical protein